MSDSGGSSAGAGSSGGGAAPAGAGSSVLDMMARAQAEMDRRKLSLDCYHEAGENVSKAVALFGMRCEAANHKVPSNAARFIRYQVAKWKETQSLDNRPHPPHDRWHNNP